MNIAVASGKGGTGKTTVATNLALVAAVELDTVVYADCDVEEPNGHLFLKPSLVGRRTVHKRVPKVDPQRCDGCGACARFCQFGAIVCLGTRVLVYPELCHGCGGCARVCPQHAIAEQPQEIGEIEWGDAKGAGFYQGRLTVGEYQSPPVIRAVKTAVPPADLILFDAPPGTSCPVVETMRHTDFVLVVTEPTPFGLHDLNLALDLVRTLKRKCGIIVNRAVAGRLDAGRLCSQAGVPILAEIPDDLAVAKAYSEGHLAVEAVTGYRQLYVDMLRKVLSLCRNSSS